MAQLVARYLGVVEAAGSSPVTQTRKTGIVRFPFFFCFPAKARESLRFRGKYDGLVPSRIGVGTSPFFAFDHM